MSTTTNVTLPFDTQLLQQMLSQFLTFYQQYFQQMLQLQMLLSIMQMYIALFSMFMRLLPTPTTFGITVTPTVGFGGI